MDYSLIAASLMACSGFFPQNNLSIPVSNKKQGLSKEQYNQVIDKVSRVYQDVVTEYGGKLIINRKWSNPTVNAGTLRRKDEWHINLYGGMARHKYMTEDAYALVLCHELGHHIGGAPKKIYDGKKHWASTEGQSDYWASLKCLRRVLEDEDNDAAISHSEIPRVVEEKCETALCKRISLASLSISRINAQIRRREEPSFSTPDMSQVERTYDAHPVAQCRLDTLFNGALCPIRWRESVSQTNEATGTCHPMDGYKRGIRPLCWYSSTMKQWF